MDAVLEVQSTLSLTMILVLDGVVPPDTYTQSHTLVKVLLLRVIPLVDRSGQVQKLVLARSFPRHTTYISLVIVQ